MKQAKSKYQDQIIDGMWKVKNVKIQGDRRYFTLQNIYNKTKVELTSGQLSEVDKGKTSVSKIISHRIRYKIRAYSSSCITTKQQKYAYSKIREW